MPLTVRYLTEIAPSLLLTLNRGFAPIVMVGLGPTIHVFLCSLIARRGWLAAALRRACFAGHDDEGRAAVLSRARRPTAGVNSQ